MKKVLGVVLPVDGGYLITSARGGATNLLLQPRSALGVGYVDPFVRWRARYSVPGCPVFEPGEEALLFVWRDPAGRAQVNGLAQGKFDIRRDAKSGERFVQRAIPGFGVRDLKTLRAVPAGQALPQLPLDDLVREITRTLALEDHR